MADEPMTDEELAEIKRCQDETRAEMDEWYISHPNPQWRREHPFDHDSVVTNTHVYITIPALLAELTRLRSLTSGQFIREKIQRSQELDAHDRARWLDLLDEWEKEYRTQDGK